MENFQTARGIAAVLKVVGFLMLGLALVLFIIMARDAQGGVSMAFVTFVPAILTSALLVLFSEIARAVISSAESSLLIRDDLVALKVLASSSQLGQRSEGSVTTASGALPVGRKAFAAQVGVADQVQVLQVWKGHRIVANNGRDIRIGTRQFANLETARNAIDAGEFD